MPETSSRSPGLLLTALCAAGMLAATMQTAVVPILGNIGDQTGASPGALSWIVTANLLSSAVTTPLFGRLGDLRGKRASSPRSRPPCRCSSSPGSSRARSPASSRSP
jgi:MFS family permease